MSIAPAAVFVFNAAGMEELLLLCVLELHLMVLFSVFQKKKRTHDLGGKQGPPLPEDKVPKSFVLGRGKLPPPLQNLRHDLRKLMMPHTAMNLKV
jgi:hypothetical protein